MKRFHTLLIIFLALSCAFQTNAQSFLTTSGHDIVNEEGETFLLRGMGLGGWMSGEIYDLTQSYKYAFVNGIVWNLINVLIVSYIMWKVIFSKNNISKAN